MHIKLLKAIVLTFTILSVSSCIPDHFVASHNLSSRVRAVHISFTKINQSAIRFDAASIVKISASLPNAIQLGTGFIAASFMRDRHRISFVVTNYHVIQGSAHITVISEHGTRYFARVVRTDQRQDLVLLAVRGLKGAPLCLASHPPMPGEYLATLGHPQGGPLRESTGRFRGLATVITPEGSSRAYAVLLKLQPGNSGGPLLGPSGRVLGVVFARGSGRNSNVGFAISWYSLRTFLPRLHQCQHSLKTPKVHPLAAKKKKN
jgi:S1-C subfamily serine protease